jgi:hypothetical protein
MVSEEAHEEQQRELAQVADAGRPDRRAHGQQITALEIGAITPGVQQALEMRVGPVVEDDETGVDGVVTILQTDIDGGGVSAQAFGRLEQRDLVSARQIPGGGHAADATADHGDALAAGW